VILVDSNVILDVFTKDKVWFESSSKLLAELAEDNELAINPIIYSEVSIRFSRIETLEESLPSSMFKRLAIPWEAAFLAGKCFLQYKKRDGKKTSPLPDFIIGAHAAIEGHGLLTRDINRYRTYFPKVKLFIPKK